MEEFVRSGAGQDYVYRHYDEDGLLLYVGVSNDVGRRLEQHSKTAPWARRVSRTTIVSFPDRESALAGEREAIETEKPTYNSTYNFDDIRLSRMDRDMVGDMSNEEFRAIRQYLRITQGELAKHLGYSSAMQVSIYERKTNPRPVGNILGKLMRAFEAGYGSPDWHNHHSRKSANS